MLDTLARCGVITDTKFVGTRNPDRAEINGDSREFDSMFLVTNGCASRQFGTTIRAPRKLQGAGDAGARLVAGMFDSC